MPGFIGEKKSRDYIACLKSWNLGKAMIQPYSYLILKVPHCLLVMLSEILLYINYIFMEPSIRIKGQYNPLGLNVTCLKIIKDENIYEQPT